MSNEFHGRGESKQWVAFDIYLRTGRRTATLNGDVEFKFNPYHDPRDGRFTFKPGGTLLTRDNRRGAAPGRQPVARPALSDSHSASRSYGQFDAKNPRNHSIHTVRSGDTLKRLAAQRNGVTASDLAWLNDLPIDTRLRIGQSIKLPHQAYLDAGRDAKNRFLALDFYMSTHGGNLPPNAAYPPSIQQQLSVPRRIETKNGYQFKIDFIERTQFVSGELSIGRNGTRSKQSQAKAGGTDRLPGDHGGHYIGIPFNGPRESFNHFAQEAGFNRSVYRKLEIDWAADKRAGRRVFVAIKPYYEGLSQRPYKLWVRWRVGNLVRTKEFPNPKKGR